MVDISRVEELMREDSLDSLYEACGVLFDLMTYEQFVKCAIFVIEKEMEIFKDYPLALASLRETIEDVKVNRLQKNCIGTYRLSDDYGLCDERAHYIRFHIWSFGTDAGSKAINGEWLEWENYKTYKKAHDIAEKKIWLELINYGLNILRGG